MTTDDDIFSRGLVREHVGGYAITLHRLDVRGVIPSFSWATYERRRKAHVRSPQ